MTTPIWLLEADVSGINSVALQAEVRRQGGEVHVFKPNLSAPSPRDLLGAESVLTDACALVYATHPVIEHVSRRRRWRPGAWCSFERLRCSVYYAHLGPYLLNQNYTLLPAAEVVRHASRLAETYGVGGKIFLRPDTTRKAFKGGVVPASAVELAMGSLRRDPTALVVVAEPQELKREWRLVVAGGRVVAASLYLERGVPSREAGAPAEVLAYATELLGRVAWRPDPLFMLDVCESSRGLSVLELNAFSCSAFYDAPLAEVIAAANQHASKAW